MVDMSDDEICWFCGTSGVFAIRDGHSICTGCVAERRDRTVRLCVHCGSELPLGWPTQENCQKCKAERRTENELTTTENTQESIGEWLLTAVSFCLRLFWNVVVIIVAVWLEIVWVGFLFGSVLGVVLVLLFAADLFFLPLALLSLCVSFERRA